MNLKWLKSATATSLLYKSINQLVQFFLIVYFTREYGKETWGNLALILAYLNFGSLFLTFGLNISIIKIINNKQFNIRYHYPRILFFVFFLGLIVTTLIIIWVKCFELSFLKTDTSSPIDFYIILFSVIPFSMLQINIGLFRAFSDHFKFYLFDGFMLILLSSFIYISVISHSFNIVFIVGLFVFIVSFFSTLVTLLRYYNYESCSKVSFTALLKLSVPICFTNITNQGFEKSIVLVLGYFLSKADIGIFDLIRRIALLSNNGIVAVKNVYISKFAANQNNRAVLIKLIERSMVLILIIYIPIFICIVLGNNFILTLFDINEEGISILLLIIMTGQLVNNSCGPVGVLMQMIGYENHYQVISTVNNLVHLIVLCVGLLFFGLFYALVIYTSSIIFRNLIASWYMYKKEGFTLFPTVSLFKHLKYG